MLSELAQTTQPADWWEIIPADFRPWLLWAAVALVVLLVLNRLYGRVRRWLRRRRPPTIHPSLAKYNVDYAELDRQRREQARLVQATSTTARLAGFRIIRQVEAVFVDGYRSPEDALTALKAEAAQRGANGLLNVRSERTAAGRCSASADAVVIAASTSALPGTRAGRPADPPGESHPPPGPA